MKARFKVEVNGAGEIIVKMLSNDCALSLPEVVLLQDHLRLAVDLVAEKFDPFEKWWKSVHRDERDIDYTVLDGYGVYKEIARTIWEAATKEAHETLR